MWMSDKPLVQEELAVTLSELIQCFSETEAAVQFISAFFATESREWFNIDRLRLDKFMMLIRKFLRQTLLLLQRHKWKDEIVTQVLAELAKSVLSPFDTDSPDGLKLHVADIYIDELLEAGGEDLSKEMIFKFLMPYCLFIARTKSEATLKRVIKEVFYPLIDMAVQKQDKSEKDMEEGDGEDESSEEDIASLNVDYNHLAEELFNLARGLDTPAKNRKCIYSLVKTNLAEGQLPEVKEIEDVVPDDKINYKAAMDRLQTFEENIMKKTGKQKHNKETKRPKPETGPCEDEPPKKKKKTEAENAATNENLSQVGESSPKKKEKLQSTKVKNAQENKSQKTQEKKKKKRLKKGESTEKGSGDKDTTSLGITMNSSREKPLFSGGFFESDEDNDLTEECNSKSVVISSNGKGKKNKKINNKEKERFSLQCTETETIKENSLSSKLHQGNAQIVSHSGSKKAKKATGENTEFTTDKKMKDKRKANAGLAIVPQMEVGEEQNGLDSKETMKKTKARRKSTGSDLKINPAHHSTNGVNETLLGDSEISKSQKKKKRKSLESGQPEQLAEGEIEIFIPNKKYQGSLKEAFEKKMKKSIGIDSPVKSQAKQSPKKKLKQNFINFETGTKTPPAFVRKSIDKLKTPQTEPRKKLKKQIMQGLADSAPGKKRRVSFVLERNMAQDFEDSLTLSPAVPFDPKNIPDRTILKDNKSPRAKASDFF